MRYEFITGFCRSESNTDPEDIRIGRDHNGQHFALSSFAFADQEVAEIYVHCHLSICTETVVGDGSCDIECSAGPRSRRSSITEAQPVSIAIGPIQVGTNNQF